MHTPIDKTEETHLSTELFDALAFANQKLEELVLIHSALTQGTESISNELETYRNVHHTIRSSAARNREDVKAARTALKEEDFSRPLPFEKRYELQQVALELPLLPTTTIGSFPQTTEVRQTRKEWRNGVISNEQYEQFIEKRQKNGFVTKKKLGLMSLYMVNLKELTWSNILVSALLVSHSLKRLGTIIRFPLRKTTCYLW